MKRWMWVACLAAGWGCDDGSDPGGEETVEDSGVRRDASRNECQRDDQCQAGERCMAGRCVNDGCRSDDDCGDIEECRGGACVPRPECGVDPDCPGDQVCSDGACVDPDPECRTDEDCDNPREHCVNGVCEDRDDCEHMQCCTSEDCAEGETCVNGSCEPPPCGDGFCDDGQTCVEDACRWLCDADRDCPIGDQICGAEGYCVDPPACDPPCAEDEFCEAGECVVPLEECVKDQNCPVGELCGDQGVCVDDPSICDPPCGADQRCVDNACVGMSPECEDDLQCPAGERCEGGECVLDCECEDDLDCPGGQNCNCQCEEPEVCGGDLDCFEGRICDANGACVDPCMDDAACPGSLACIDGECRERPCAEDDDCPAGEECVDLVCMSAIGCEGDDANCPDGEICVAAGDNSLCVPGCREDEQCAPDEACVDDQCELACDCAQDEDCAAGSLCDACQCIEAECLQDDDCALGDLCVDQRCVARPECVDDGECAPGEVCVDQRCEPDPPCVVDADCPGDRVCDFGFCVAAGCEEDADCGPNRFCVDGACRDICGCADDNDCEPEFICADCVCLPANACVGAAPADLGETRGQTAGDSRFETNCGDGGSGPDAVFALAPQPAGLVCASTFGSAFDTIVSVRTGCDVDAEVACNDDDGFNGGLTSAVEFEHDGASDYFIVVDGFADSGDFVLTLSSGPCAPEGCEVDADCAPGERCQGGECVLEEGCAEDADCPPGSICEGGECVPRGGCEEDGECPPGEVCIDGGCHPDVECRVDEDCGPNEVCEDNACGPECAEDADCAGNEVCRAGACGPECLGDDDCPGDGVCRAGECGPQCLDDAECPGDQVCREGACGPQCLDDADCAEEEVCREGSCGPECLADEDCPGVEICDAGACRLECLEDADCDGICEANQCVLAECAVDADCPLGDFCDAGRCAADPFNACFDPQPILGFGPTEGEIAGIGRFGASCGGGADGPEQVFLLNVNQTGDFCLNTRGSAVDTVLHVREEGCADPVHEILCNDDELNGRGSSAITMRVEANTDYFVFVDGFAQSEGPFVLNFNPGECDVLLECEADEDCLPGESCVDNECVAVPFTCFNPEPIVAFGALDGDTSGLLADNGAQCGGGAAGPEAVYVFSVDGAGPVCLSTVGSSFDTVLHVREAECQDPNAEVACNDDAVGRTSELTLNALANTNYFVFVDGFGPANGQYTFTIAPGACGEAGGNTGTCAAPLPVEALGPQAGTTLGAPDAHQGSCGNSTGGDSVHVVQVDADTDLCLDTRGSAHDTVLYVREAPCAGGAEVACNDDSPLAGGLQSAITLAATADTPYYVFVDGFGGARGDYTLNVRLGACDQEPPAADLTCENPGPIEAFQPFPGNSAGLDANTTGSCGGNGPEAIYVFQLGADGQVCLDTNGSAIDTVLHVREAACAEANNEVACNDDGGNGLASRLTVNATGGVPYFVYVDSFGAGGDYVLNVAPGACP